MDYPSFSWDIVPQYWYSTNPTGDFDDDTAAYAASFPIVVPNGNHRRWVEPSARQEESKLYAVAQQILAKNASAKLIFYLNTMMDWTQFELHHTLAGYESNGTQYWNRNNQNKTLCINSQPIFNHSSSSTRAQWISTVTTAMNTGLYYGVFADRANALPKGKLGTHPGAAGTVATDGVWDAATSTCLSDGTDRPFTYDRDAYDNWNNDHAMMITAAQEAVGQSKVIIANNNNSATLARHWEQWCNNDYDGATIVEAIANLQKLSSEGVVTMVHTGHLGHTCDHDKMPLSLSAFLIGAGEYSYYSCTDGWRIDQGWLKSARWSWADYALGAPTGPATMTAFANGTHHYERTFTSGTRVTLSLLNTSRDSGDGCIFWANGVTYGSCAASPPPSLPPAPPTTPCGAACSASWDASAGSRTCGQRIDHFITEKGLSASAACERIAGRFATCSSCMPSADEDSSGFGTVVGWIDSSRAASSAAKRA